MKKVLLLNANGEPLSLIPWTRALTLVLKRKVNVFEYFEGESVRSAEQEFRLPSVVALIRYVMIPNRRYIGLNKKNVLARDGYECQYCRCHLTESSATVDHVIPTCRGGAHAWTNVVASCKPCNNRKDRRTPEEAHMTLKRSPWVPSRVLLIKERVERMGIPQWAPYFGTT
jgi:5-methylcytosine-specific restriction endonuclease McrA